MAKREQQMERFREALDRKSEAAREASRQAARNAADSEITPDAAAQPGSASDSADALSPRAKSSGHGKKTADKWNQ
jgi:hypothetical protein